MGQQYHRSTATVTVRSGNAPQDRSQNVDGRDEPGHDESIFCDCYQKPNCARADFTSRRLKNFVACRWMLLLEMLKPPTLKLSSL